MRKLAPGFRFHPTDVELVKYYLKRKVLGKKFKFEAIAEVDIYKYAPDDLPDKSCLPSKDLKWYFFCPRERRYSSGPRAKRAAEGGYWKTTGRDRPVNYNGDEVGTIKTLVFHQGRAPDGKRTDWVMHEYTLKEKALAESVIQDSYVLCMVFKKEGPGPRNGAQYGAPFVEEEWTDDEESCLEVDPSAKTSVPNILLPTGDHTASSSHPPESICAGPSTESCVSVSGTDASHHNNSKASVVFGSSCNSCVLNTVPPSCGIPHSVSGSDAQLEDLPVIDNDDILSYLDCFVEAGPFNVNENDKNKDSNNPDHDAAVAEQAYIFEGLPDLGNLAVLNGDGFGFSDANASYVYDTTSFLELTDLDAPLNQDPSSRSSPP